MNVFIVAFMSSVMVQFLSKNNNIGIFIEPAQPPISTIIRFFSLRSDADNSKIVEKHLFFFSPILLLHHLRNIHCLYVYDNDVSDIQMMTLGCKNDLIFHQ